MGLKIRIAEMSLVPLPGHYLPPRQGPCPPDRIPQGSPLPYHEAARHARVWHPVPRIG